MVRPQLASSARTTLTCVNDFGQAFSNDSRGDFTVADFIALHASEIWSFLTGLVGGGAAGSLITYRVTRTNRASGHSSVVDQSGAAARGDIVGGDKSQYR